MSDILINGMEMPKTHPLTVTIYPDGQVLSETVGAKDKHGEAVPVPPHYDLIDHNALKISVMDYDAETRIDFLKHAMDCINKAPVVIPSDMPTYEAEDGE